MKYTVSLKENHLFRRLYQKGKRYVRPALVLYVLPCRRRENVLGFTVSRKIGKAVVRNRIRRRLREAYRIHESQITPGHLLVFVARTRAAFVPYAELERELLQLLREAGAAAK